MVRAYENLLKRAWLPLSYVITWVFWMVDCFPFIKNTSTLMAAILQSAFMSVLTFWLTALTLFALLIVLGSVVLVLKAGAATLNISTES